MIKVFLKKERKRIYFYNHCLTWGKFSQANGQEGRGAENTIVLWNVVVFLHENGEHSAETYYNSIVQWSNDKIEETSAMKQWRKKALHINIYECNEATMVLLRLYIILSTIAMKQDVYTSRQVIDYERFHGSSACTTVAFLNKNDLMHYVVVHRHAN